MGRCLLQAACRIVSKHLLQVLASGSTPMYRAHMTVLPRVSTAWSMGSAADSRQTDLRRGLGPEEFHSGKDHEAIALREAVRVLDCLHVDNYPRLYSRRPRVAASCSDVCTSARREEGASPVDASTFLSPAVRYSSFQRNHSPPGQHLAQLRPLSASGKPARMECFHACNGSRRAHAHRT